jgi:hypothetical protein
MVSLKTQVAILGLTMLLVGCALPEADGQARLTHGHGALERGAQGVVGDTCILSTVGTIEAEWKMELGPCKASSLTAGEMHSIRRIKDLHK